MIRWLYEQILLRGIGTVPARICFMITESDVEVCPGRIGEVTSWCILINQHLAAKGEQEAGSTCIRGITFHVSTPDPSRIDPYLPELRKVGDRARLHLHSGERTEVSGEGMEVCIAVGKSGREEIVDCIQRMAEDGLPPDTVSERTFEEYLAFPYAPDLVIKTGGSHLTDFLIWQSVYSELFFSDVNWRLFRKVDFLRALRDYQSRLRRFGR